MLMLFDQDGALTDFEHGVHHGWQARYGVPAPVANPRRHFYARDDMAAKQRQALIDLYCAPGLFANLPPLHGALDTAHAPLAAGHNLSICPSPISQYRHCPSEKIAWAEQHLASDWGTRIILTKAKTWVRGSILIDDKPEITGRLSPQWQHRLCDAPYNRHIATAHRIH